MKLRYSTFAWIAVTLFIASSAFAQHVKTDYDRGADFSQYKSYSWEKVQARDQLWIPRIEDAVNAELAAKGWTQVPSGGQVAIVAMEVTQNQQTLNTFYDGFGGGWGWRRFGGEDSETPPPRQKPIRSGLSLLISSTQAVRHCSGGGRPAILSRTNQRRTSRISTKLWRRCSIIFLRT
jgi:hypothetical protein